MSDNAPTPILADAVEHARRRAVDWLWSMQAPGFPRGVLRVSAAHDPARWPGVTLYGTYDGAMALGLLGGFDRTSPEERRALADWLLAHRRPDGVFRVPGMADDAIFKKPDPVETRRYIDFHVTNYCLGALEAIGDPRPPVLDFALPFLEPLFLEAWLSRRDFRDPWQEGNNIVNLGSFLLLLARHGDEATRRRVETALAILFDWHDRHQEPTTGFWGVNQTDPTGRLHAFAGAMHNFHLWYALGRPLPFQDRAVDYVLTLDRGITSACIDVDAVDLLVHAARMIDHRRPEIDTFLADKLTALLAFQREDGGFADIPEGTRRQDGWVGGYEEPQGRSNTFATFFRMIAVAMIADHFWPGRFAWGFRRMIGIGYRGPRRP